MRDSTKSAENPKLAFLFSSLSLTDAPELLQMDSEQSIQRGGEH